MLVVRLLLGVYFLVSIRALGQDIYDGVANSMTYVQTVIAVTVIVVCIAYPRLREWAVQNEPRANK